MTDFYHYVNTWMNAGSWIFLLLYQKSYPINKCYKSLSPKMCFKICLSLFLMTPCAESQREHVSPRAPQGSNDLKTLNLSTCNDLRAKWRARVWESDVIIQCLIFMRWIDCAVLVAERRIKSRGARWLNLQLIRVHWSHRDVVTSYETMARYTEEHWEYRECHA